MSLTSYRAAPPRAKALPPIRCGEKPQTSTGGAINDRVSGDQDVSGRPGDDLLSRALRQSTIGATSFHDRVRNGIGWDTCAITTWSSRHICINTDTRAVAMQRRCAIYKEDIQNWSVACQSNTCGRLPLRTADQAYRTISTN